MVVKYLKETPSQTGGPYVHIGTAPAAAGLDMRTQEKLHVSGLKSGTPIVLDCRIRDGAGDPVVDAMMEIWGADENGVFDDDGHAGWARAVADTGSGVYRFETMKPGRVAWRDGRPQAPHLSLVVFARGINLHLQTRIYFDDEAEANSQDPVLLQIPSPRLRETLLARARKGATSATYDFEIVLQGTDETVFFDM
ncbi:MAG: protocatechuate 3,4-dioxygenase subunit alpha [Flavobacteriaceae bacterium]